MAVNSRSHGTGAGRGLSVREAHENSVREAHENFVADHGARHSDSAADIGLPDVRALVADSWMRSAAAGVDADSGSVPIATASDELVDYRASHPLSAVFPLLYDVLGQAAESCEAVLALGDADGRLLWVCGQPAVLRKAERINFVEGSSWDEQHAGTNAPGTALRLDTPVHISAAEHFLRQVQPWSCAAAPIHDPETHTILGVVDVTGGRDIDSPQTMAMVRAAARMAEAELGRIAALARNSTAVRPGAVGGRGANPLWTPDSDTRLRIDALGRPDCVVDDGRRVLRLSERHSEILTILADTPGGVTGDQLAIEVYAGDVNASTMRAEMTRLRGLLGLSVLQSRPYRLRVEAVCDWAAIPALLATGDISGALRGYRGPLLPGSEAPGIVERRERLHRQLRAAVLASGHPELMVAWTRSRWGNEDLEVWRRQAELLPPSSPLRPIARAEARRLDESLGSPWPAVGRRAPRPSF